MPNVEDVESREEAALAFAMASLGGGNRSGIEIGVCPLHWVLDIERVVKEGMCRALDWWWDGATPPRC